MTLTGRANIADPPVDLATITIQARPYGTLDTDTVGVGSFNADGGDPINVPIPRGYLVNCRIVTTLGTYLEACGGGSVSRNERILISVILAKFQV